MKLLPFPVFEVCKASMPYVDDSDCDGYALMIYWLCFVLEIHVGKKK